MPENAETSACLPNIMKYRKDSGSSTVNGVSITQFATDHVFEIHLISDFLEWLCGTSKQLSYGGLGRLNFPSGWGRPDATWCSDVFGSKYCSMEGWYV